jgi:predicted regulator of Ras-like GTPase activity (Roadblock/LC7/MglB family)
MNTTKILGLGSRILQTNLGKGLVTNVSSNQHWVTFMNMGLEMIYVIYNRHKSNV